MSLLSFLNPILAPINAVLESEPVQSAVGKVESVIDKAQIKEAFKKVFGKEPSESEIEEIAKAQIYNSSYNEDVIRRTKALLKTLGYPVELNGDSTYTFVASLMKFQKKDGRLQANGKLTPATIAELSKIAAGNSSLAQKTKNSSSIPAYVFAVPVVIAVAYIAWRHCQLPPTEVGSL